MIAKWSFVLVALMLLGGCGRADDDPAAEERESVFDPLTDTVERARGVEDTVREQAEETRRRIEEETGN